MGQHLSPLVFAKWVFSCNEQLKNLWCHLICLCFFVSLSVVLFLFGAFQAFETRRFKAGTKVPHVVSQSVSRVFQGCSNGIIKIVQGIFAIKVFQGSFKGVSRVFWRSLKGVLWRDQHRVGRGGFWDLSILRNGLTWPIV